MNAPKRWLDEGGGATAEERAVLGAGVELEPGADAKRGAWLALGAKIASGSGAAGAAGSAAASGGQGAASGGAAAAGATKVAAGGKAVAASLGAHAAGGGLVSAALLGAGCAVVLLAGSTWIDRRQASDVGARPAPALVASAPVVARAAPRSPREPSIPAELVATPTEDLAAGDAVHSAEETRGSSPSSPRARASIPVEAASAEAPTPAPVEPNFVLPGASASAAGSSALAERESRLREESLLVARARDALRSGDLGACFALLESARTRFPQGMLGQEREALAIEALAASGQRAAAADRARAFLRAYPASPHAPRLRSFAE